MEDQKLNAPPQSKALEITLKESVERACQLSLILSFVFVFYGVPSLSFIQRFQPDVSLWSNLWPRFILNGVPLFLLGIYLKKIKISNQNKLYFWISGIGLILHAAAWIHVWPIALLQDASILPFVNAANVFLFTLIFVVIAPPVQSLPVFAGIFSVTFVIPLFVVSYLSKDPIVFNLMLSDSLISIAVNMLLSMIIHKLRMHIACLELERASDVSRFIAPPIFKAIYENRKDLLQTRKASGLLLNMDIRGYTKLFQSGSQVQFEELMAKYLAHVSETVNKFGGVIHRTAGDGHLISFGLLDDPVDLSDIPDIQTELKQAEFKKWQNFLQNAFCCLEEIVVGSHKLVLNAAFSQLIKIGAGLDFGEVELKIVGDPNSREELELFGPSLIRVARLESHTKVISDLFRPTSSLLILSPEASNFLKEENQVTKIDTGLHAIRDFPEIRQIYVKEFQIETNSQESGVVLPEAAA